jgi:hypothetical protein
MAPDLKIILLIYTIIVQNVMLLPQSAHLVHFMSIIRSTIMFPSLSGLHIVVVRGLVYQISSIIATIVHLKS